MTNKEFPLFALAQDHVTYWQNYEVMELILQSAASTPALREPDHHPNGLQRTMREILPSRGA